MKLRYGRNVIGAGELEEVGRTVYAVLTGDGYGCGLRSVEGDGRGDGLNNYGGDGAGAANHGGNGYASRTPPGEHQYR